MRSREEIVESLEGISEPVIIRSYARDGRLVELSHAQHAEQEITSKMAILAEAMLLLLSDTTQSRTTRSRLNKLVERVRNSK